MKKLLPKEKILPSRTCTGCECTTAQHKGFTHVDVEVTVVDINAVDRLPEVDVGNAVGADIVVVNDTELEARDGRLDKLGRGLDVVGGALGDGHDLGRVGRQLGALVFGDLGHEEAVDVDSAPRQRRSMGLAPLGVGLDVGREAREAEEDEGPHSGEDGGNERLRLVVLGLDSSLVCHVETRDDGIALYHGDRGALHDEKLLNFLFERRGRCRYRETPHRSADMP